MLYAQAWKAYLSMKNNILSPEIIVSLSLLLSLFVLFDPFHLLMLSMAQMLLLCLVAVIFSAYAIFLFREQTRDEREEKHKYIGNRFGYLLGSTTLVLAIIVEKLGHHQIGWLLLALASMVFGKLVGLLFARHKY